MVDCLHLDNSIWVPNLHAHCTKIWHFKPTKTEEFLFSTWDCHTWYSPHQYHHYETSQALADYVWPLPYYARPALLVKPSHYDHYYAWPSSVYVVERVFSFSKTPSMTSKAEYRRITLNLPLCCSNSCLTIVLQHIRSVFFRSICVLLYL